jgi:hypothetical protein
LAYAPALGEWDYVLKEERELPEGEKTTWILGPLTFRDWEEIVGKSLRSDIDGGIHVAVNAMTQARKVLNRGLRGWRNFRREDGSEVQFRTVDENGRRILPEEVLDAVARYAIELANAITEGSRLSEGVVKNSGSP